MKKHSTEPKRAQISTKQANNFPVVGIGASAGGLDACRKLVDQIPPGSGMAFILVQHLDPTHESMMVNLLASHTSLAVQQATSGMQVQPNHFYIIPPGKYLAVKDGALQLSPAVHGARLPFDFLLASLALEFGARARCVILSGTGADGSTGLLAIHQHGGVVFVQKPEEADYDGMPRSAIATGLVDHVLPVGKIPEALSQRSLNGAPALSTGDAPASPDALDSLRAIIELLCTNTAHNFTLYKQGTLKRRVERRMAMAGVGGDNMDHYLAVLRADSSELNLLANDLLINITSFFRDPRIYEHLASDIIPELVRNHTPGQPIRIWVAGCSSGEEAYSLAIMFREEIAAAKSNIKLQVFASDVDSEAVASARAGVYLDTIAAEVSAERLERFFIKEEKNYRVQPELRAMVVFTVQDVLSDPPFSRLDLVSCRNLLIYLGPEAQAKVIASFHFALREGGILLLGSSETISHPDGRFETLSKTDRIYKRIGHNRPGDFGLSPLPSDSTRVAVRTGFTPSSRQGALADLCRQSILEAFAPAAILINHKHECLYLSGPTDKYLRVASGHPSQDLLAMAPQGVRIKLRAAIVEAIKDKARVVVDSGLLDREGALASFRIEVRPVASKSEDLLLICFVDQPGGGHKPSRVPTGPDISRVAELEQELGVSRMELQGAIRSLELLNEEQKAINEEALSVNEEFQSTNEELLTSKEELQSLNEELTALNSQLQETLERQRTTSNDLQNILYSTDVATLFLDTSLKIRFFTPATTAQFSVIPGDVGRPLSDLRSLAADGNLTSDATRVLESLEPVDREIEAQEGRWFIRRILPYRAQNHAVEGIVITFTDITERKRIRQEVEAAKRVAEQANLAKSRFLAAASHDLRQPLQTLALLQGLLAKNVQGEKAQKLVRRLDETLGSMSGMLNTLLDINQIDSGIVKPTIVDFAVGNLLARLKNEFGYHAKAQGLSLRVVGCRRVVRTDPALLEQMLRNLLANALKYTPAGKVLIGCRKRGNTLKIEVWDTGIGIAEQELQAIFNEYHQIDNAARERARGLGLGLSIVRRLAHLLDHTISVRSNKGKGSVFAIEVNLAAEPAIPRQTTLVAPAGAKATHPPRPKGTIALIEDDPEVRDLLQQILGEVGHIVLAYPDGLSAIAAAKLGQIMPDLVLADFNLPHGLDGLEATTKMLEQLSRSVPVVILTGDISTRTLRSIGERGCVHVSKPVKAQEILKIVAQMLMVPPPALKISLPVVPVAAINADKNIIYVVDDDRSLCDAMRTVLADDGQRVDTFLSCEAFLAAYQPAHGACLLVDAHLPGMSGIDLLRRLQETSRSLPSIMMTGTSDVPTAIAAMKAGASDFIEKPVSATELLAIVHRVMVQARDTRARDEWHGIAASRMAGLTARQHTIMELVLAGHASKNIATDLRISQRTVETHRAAIMKKTGAKSLPALARLAMAAGFDGGPAHKTTPTSGQA